MARKSIIIIGAGIAGLSAGCYAQMNGFDSQIFELHYLPGGLCTSWRRGEYVFDGGIRYITGTREGSTVHRLWEELGLLHTRPIYYYDEFSRFVAADGRAFHLYTDIDRLETHMLELSPQDAEPIRELADALRSFRGLELPVDITPADPLEALELGKGVFGALPALVRWGQKSLLEFADRFQDPLLREALPSFFQFSPPDFPMMLMLSLVAMLHDREAGYPIGGSLQLAEDLARRYLTLGGRIHYKARVDKVLLNGELARAATVDTAEAGRHRPARQAVGVRVSQDATRGLAGTEHCADIVISACDGHSAIFDLLGGQFVDDRVRSYYETMPLTRSLIQVSLGVDRDLSGEPPSISFPLGRPLRAGNMAYDRLVLKHYCFDPTAAPAGKSVLSVWLEADYGYWKGLYADPAAYAAAKSEVAGQVIAALDARYPGLSTDVEFVDVATPVTYERYTANWRGAFAGWAMTTRKMSMMMGRAMRKTLPGLDNFYMIGQWVEPGGNVELSAASGRDVVKDICREEGREFRTQ